MKVVLSVALLLFMTVNPVYASDNTVRSSDHLKQILHDHIAESRSCGRYLDAAQSTYDRINSGLTFDVPNAGRIILVNLPSQMLYAYDNGSLALRSKVIIGSPGWATPELDTEITFVRLNPDWTVPQSIINARGWREKLLDNPSYFARQHFSIIGADGASYSPHNFVASGQRASGFVQHPSETNALGLVKFGLHNAGAIFLHDTNAKTLFQATNRARSHGCVRVEKALDLAAWILGISRSDVDNLLAANDRKNRTSFPSPVKVVMGYWTAWPDVEGKISFHSDVYEKDRSLARECPWATRNSNTAISPPQRAYFE